MTSDGCTGAPWLHWFWEPTYQCCVDHDLGGSDLELFICWLQSGVPWWLVFILAPLLFLLRPIYHLIKPWIDPILIALFSRR